MSEWKAGASKKRVEGAARYFAKEILKVAADIKMVGDGKLMIAQTTFKEWRKKLKAIAADKKNDLAEELLILAGRFFREVGEQATEVIAQLMVLAADLTGATFDEEEEAATVPAAPKAGAPKAAAPKAAAKPKANTAPAPVPAKKPAAASKKPATATRKAR